ncbi:cyclin-L1-1-like [Lycium barbarum]|uniref:cyclin-L1-1-like n=1 Tax=Lycium barbarum TaxID=112863 RepID=UPI00293F4DAE|nr:cyclin-L1-1-like [Lycium barbarum]
MATGQVLFHRFYSKKSFACFNVKRVAASCVWLASKLEEILREAMHVLIVFHIMECRRENLPIEHLDLTSEIYIDLKADLIRIEMHLLKEIGFICHVKHPHIFISNYLAALETSQELRQEAWNLANDSLRTTLCVRFKSEVVACGVVYAAARRFRVPLPKKPPWWKAFDANKAGIDEVCRVLTHLYSLPKAQYIPVCKEGGSFAILNRSRDSPSLPLSKEGSVNEDTREAVTKVALDKLKDSKKSDDYSKSMPSEGEYSKGEPRKTLYRTDGGAEKNKERERDRSERERDKERLKSRERDRGRERDDFDREREKSKKRSYHSRDKGHSEKPKHHSSRDRDYQSYSSQEKNRCRHH